MAMAMAMAMAQVQVQVQAMVLVPEQHQDLELELVHQSPVAGRVPVRALARERELRSPIYFWTQRFPVPAHPRRQLQTYRFGRAQDWRSDTSLLSLPGP